jgi:superfamily II DNA helicase RecQ
MVEEDLTLYAKDALNLIMELVDGRDRVTQNYCALVYRGSKVKEITTRGHNYLPLFGVGKGLEKTKVERMFNHLISMKALRLESVSNAQGWNNVYLQVALYISAASISYSPYLPDGRACWRHSRRQGKGRTQILRKGEK